MTQPNMLWICTDSQRWDTLSCYGNAFVRTPAIDRLAAEGVLFENAYCQNPLCSPSRGNFLTGRYPVTNRLRQNGQDMPPTEKLVTRILADDGYVCGLSGKLHICACDHRIRNLGPEWWRYDESLYFKGVEPRIDDGYTEFHWDHAPSGRYRSSAYTRWLQERGLEPEGRPRRQGGRAAVPSGPREDSEHVLHGMPSEHHQATFCAEKAIEFMRAYADAPGPWLFSVNIFDPHFGLDPPDEFLEPYLEGLDELPLPNFVEGELDGKPPYQDAFASRGRFDRTKMTERDHRMCRAAYWAMCDHIDVQVGRMLDALEETGQRGKTLVIFTSDHGEMLGDHGIYIKGPFMYEGAVHVPLVVSWPGVLEGGRRVGSLVELGDLAPTLLDAAELPRHPGMQAKSFWPHLAGSSGASGLNDARPADYGGLAEIGGARAAKRSRSYKRDFDGFRDDVYCEYYNSNPNKPPQFCTMVRTERFKIVVWHGQELGELYDLERDPDETHNLWDDASSAEVKMRMLKLVCDRMAQTADPLPPRIGIY